MTRSHKTIIIIGTGGTIAGNATDAKELVNYVAGDKNTDELLYGIPIPSNVIIESIDLCKIDSKDMSFAILKKMVVLLQELISRSDVDGIVITHGTDTLEETGVFLRHTLTASKPIVLTASMRPATALSADGPINLLDAINVAASNVKGVFTVINNTVYLAHEVIKSHTLKVDGFYAAEFGAIGYVYNSIVEWFRKNNDDSLEQCAINLLPDNDEEYPWVEILYSDVSASSRIIPLLESAGVDGLVIVGTGNGTVHENLLAEINKMAKKIPIILTTRVPTGKVVSYHDKMKSSPYSHPAKARVWLTLKLLSLMKSE